MMHFIRTLFIVNLSFATLLHCSTFKHFYQNDIRYISLFGLLILVINGPCSRYVEYVKNIKHFISRNSPLPNLNARSYSEDITSR